MKYLFAILSLFFLVSCKDQGPNGNYTGKFPTKVNNSWEYNSKFITEYYDSHGKIVNKETQDLGSTFLTIKSTNAVLPGYTNLVLFECYDAATPQNIVRQWYRNSANELSLIAYSNAGSSQPIYPKASGNRTHLNLSEFREMIKSGSFSFLTAFDSSSNDSIRYFNPARKVLTYPLVIGVKWIELEQPFYRERIVDNVLKLTIYNVSYNCYKIVVNWPGFNAKFDDYISLDAGLVKRVVSDDSIATYDSDGTKLENYVKVTQQYILKGKNF